MQFPMHIHCGLQANKHIPSPLLTSNSQEFCKESQNREIKLKKTAAKEDSYVGSTHNKYKEPEHKLSPLRTLLCPSLPINAIAQAVGILSTSSTQALQGNNFKQSLVN